MKNKLKSKMGHLDLKRLVERNRPFPNYLWPLFQSEAWGSSFHMIISFHSHANENTRTRFEKEAKGNSEIRKY